MARNKGVRKLNDNKKEKGTKKKKAVKKTANSYRPRYESWNSGWVAKPKVVVPVLDMDIATKSTKIDLMRRIFEVQSHSSQEHEMRDFLQEYIWGLNDTTILLDEDGYGNLYVTKGDANTYPCIVSHIDTVHNLISDEDYIVMNNKNNFFAVDKQKMERAGVGGDDKNGIYCCLDNLVKFDCIKLAFFVEEEIGCVGSGFADMTFFEDVSFVLEADRKGYTDVVNEIHGTTLFTKEFEDKLKPTFKKHCREVSSGGMTDVMQLANNGLDVCMANFSCGYYNPHRDTEYVVINELILTSILFSDIIREMYIDGEKWEIKRVDVLDNFEDYVYTDYSGGTNKVTDLSGSGKLLGSESIRYDYDTTEDCARCGCSLVVDVDADLYYCHGCQDYDYTKGGTSDMK